MMITQMGMSENLGQVAWSQSGGQSFVGQQMGQPADCSNATNDQIDVEIKNIVERAYRCVCPFVSLVCVKSQSGRCKLSAQGHI